MDVELVLSLSFCILLGIFVVWLVRYSRRLVKKMQALWSRLAKDIGVEEVPIPPDIPWWKTKPIFKLLDGNPQGRHFRAKQVIRGGGKSSVSYFVFHITCKSRSQWKFQLTTEHLFSGIGKMLGMQDIIIGDEEFDKRFMVKSDNESLLKMALEPGIRRKLVTHISTNGLLRLENGELYYEQLSYPFNDAQYDALKNRLLFLIELAGRLEEI